MVKNVAENTQILKSYTFPKIIDFPRYNTKCSRKKRDTTRNFLCSISFSFTFRVISRKFELPFELCSFVRVPDTGSYNRHVMA